VPQSCIVVMGRVEFELSDAIVKGCERLNYFYRWLRFTSSLRQKTSWSRHVPVNECYCIVERLATSGLTFFHCYRRSPKCINRVKILLVTERVCLQLPLPCGARSGSNCFSFIHLKRHINRTTFREQYTHMTSTNNGAAGLVRSARRISSTPSWPI
jgi:hypothetical protein